MVLLPHERGFWQTSLHELRAKSQANLEQRGNAHVWVDGEDGRELQIPKPSNPG